MTTRARVGDRCARYRPSHEISPLVVQSTPSIRLDSSSKAFSRASIRSCSTHAARSISASHASWISRRPSGRVRYRYLDVTSARHPNNNRNTATTGIIVGPSSACLTSGLIKRLYGPILTTPHQTKWRGVAPTTRSARTQFLRRKKSTRMADGRLKIYTICGTRTVTMRLLSLCIDNIVIAL